MNQIYIDGCFSLNRAAVVEDGDLAHLYFEKINEEIQEGNVYLGRVSQIIPGMNAAFVDIGKKENAYLHFRDSVPWSAEGVKWKEKSNSIGKHIKCGMEIFVQIIGDASQYKGCKVTMKLALPGKYIVLMPLSTQRSVSRKIEDGKVAKMLQTKIQQIVPPEVGYIIRTEAVGASEAEFEEEVKALWERWLSLFNQRVTTKVPKLLTKTASTIQRAILDHLNDQTEFVKINTPEMFENIEGFLKANGLEQFIAKLKLINDPLLFDQVGIDRPIKQLTQRQVQLPQGGFLIIDETEALTMIDVNSGKSKVGYNQRELALATNLEAAVEAAKQIKLRNFGGIILIDFIDMDHPTDRQEVLKVFKEEAFKDRVGINVMGFTALGILEMTRKKAGKRVSDFYNGPCHCCMGLSSASNEKHLDDLLKDIWKKYKHNPTDIMSYQIDQHLGNFMEPLMPTIEKWLEGVTSEIEFEYLPYLQGGFKMTYMGKRKQQFASKDA